MKLLALSDLHLEFDDRWELYVQSLADQNPDVDVCALAGDIASCSMLSEVYAAFARRFKHIVAVPGNHEFYGASFKQVQDVIAESMAKYRNLHVLQNNTVMIENQRFVGSTLWFKDRADNFMFEHTMNDFRLIHEFRDWVYVENIEARRFLAEAISADDVVVTHYIPSHSVVAPEYQNADNRFFVTEMGALLSVPKAWVHGHTHTSSDQTLESGTRVICNPRGYHGYELNPSFKPNLVITV